MTRSAAGRVIIVGGAIKGSFCACAPCSAGFNGRLPVVEQDPTCWYSPTALSAASRHPPFGTPVNIRMSLSAARMFRDLRGVFGKDAGIGPREHGDLIPGGVNEVPEREAAAEMHGRYPGVDAPLRIRRPTKES